METLAIALLVIGIVLIIIELFMPGFGVFGISGVISLIVSAVLTIIYIPYGAFIVMVEIVILSVLSFILFNYMRKHQLHGKLILEETLDIEKKEIFDMERFIGKEGFAKTSLRPFGTVDIGGVSVEAYADGAYIQENTKIKVIGVSNQAVKVKKISGNEN